jgi:O-antigen/teichoic acid export membrane protein
MHMGITRLWACIRRDANRLWGAGVLHVGAAGWLSRFAAVLQRILLARIIGVHGIGHIGVASSLLNIIRLPAGVGMFTAVGKLVAEHNRDVIAQRQVMGTALCIAIAASILVVLAVLPLLLWTPIVADDVARSMLIVLVLFLPLMIVVEVLRCALQGQRRMRAFAGVGLLTTVGGFCAVVLFSLFWGVRGWMTGQIVTICVTLGVLYVLLRSIISLSWSRMIARRLLAISSFAFLGQLLGTLTMHLDTLMLSGLLQNAEITGQYNTAAIAAQQMMAIPAALLTVTFPFVAENSNHTDLLRKRYRELTMKMGALAIGCSVLAIIVAPYFFMLFGPDFADSVMPFRILAIGFVALCLYILDNTFLDGVGRTDLHFYAGLATAVIACGLQWVAIPRWGMQGAAVATTSTLFISLMIRRFFVLHLVFGRRDRR